MPRLLHFILLTLFRHKVRAAIGVSGIAFGTAAMLSILAVVLGAIGMFEKILSTGTQVVVFERDVSDLFFSSVTEAEVEAVRARPEVDAAHPVLFGIVSAPGHPIVTCFGVTADHPRLAAATWLQGQPGDFGREPGLAFLGERAAQFLSAGLGDEIRLGHQTYRVGGVIRTDNGFENGGVFLPLAEAQRFFQKTGLASIVAVKLREGFAAEDLKRGLAEAQPRLLALENEEFRQGYSQFQILQFTSWAVGICAFLLGGLGVANTMLMSVFTRIREIAILRVCGFSRAQVAGLVVGESAVITLVGTALGFLLGAGLLTALHHIPQFQGYLQATVQPAMMAGIPLVALATGVGGALYPAWFAVRIQPAEALRYE